MDKKIIALILSMMIVFANFYGAYASESEFTYLTDNEYIQTFDEYEASHSNSVIELDDGNYVLEMIRTNASAYNTENIRTNGDIASDKFELEFDFLPREKQENSLAEAHVLLMEGSTLRFEFKITATSANNTKYRLTIGGKELLSTSEVLHMPFDEEEAPLLADSEFNKVKIVVERVGDGETVDAEHSTVSIYLNDEFVRSYQFANLGNSVSYAYGKKINAITIRQYHNNNDSKYRLNNKIYFDDISIRTKNKVEYIPSELSMSFNANMNYDGDPKLVISNGKDSKFLGQNMLISLVDAENPETVIPVGEAVVSKVTNEDGDTAEFSYDGEAGVTYGWYYVNVERFVDGEKKGESASQKIYVATSQQLEALPGDFSNLPENDDEAKALVEEYLPCFLTEDEINELLPADNEEQAQKNISFIVGYFKANEGEFAQISEVQSEFAKAKGYLELKNASDVSEVRTVLERGGYLEEYIENETFIENEEAFFSHFEPKRTDDENLLVSDEKIYAALRYSMAMTSINISLRSGISSIVEEYNDVFMLDLEKITEDNADKVYPVLYNKGYTSIDALRADWQTAVDEIPEEGEEEKSPEEEEKDFSGGSSNGSGGNKGSGGGGGGGGISIKSDKTNTFAPEIEPETTVEEEKNEKKELSDIGEHWAKEEINALYDMGVITGFEDNTFRPDDTLTRAEFVTMISRILPDAEVESTTEFTDVNENDWFYQSVKKAVSLGLVNGSDGKFMPHDKITREQIAVIIFRSLGVETFEENVSFSDYESVSDYAKEAIVYLATNGIISGYEDNTIRPQNNTSRAEAVKLLYGLINISEQK